MNNSIDSAWLTLFRKKRVLDVVKRQGFADVSAEDIKRIANKEPRLMAKVNSAHEMPEVFRKNSLNLISIKRGIYRIAPFNLFHEVEYDKLRQEPIRSMVIPSWLCTLASDIGKRSEAGLLSSCYASGIIGEVLNAKEDAVYPGTYGRLTTDKMRFSAKAIGATNGERVVFPCTNVQFEVDASYESPESMVILEAKNCFLSDFNIRQLYFPWRYFSEQFHKPVLPVLVMRSNDVVVLCEYGFQDANEIDSLVLVRARRYSFVDTDISLGDIQEVFSEIKRFKTARQANSEVIFPQADKMELVVDLCERLKSSSAETEEVASGLNYVHRQGHYYAEAARFLGLVEKNGTSRYSLSKDGVRIFDMPYKQRQLSLVRQILKFKVFAKCLKFALENSHLPDAQQVASWIADDKWPISSSTLHRRAGTVLGWIRWILKLTNS